MSPILTTSTASNHMTSDVSGVMAPTKVSYCVDAELGLHSPNQCVKPLTHSKPEAQRPKQQ